MVRQDTNLLSKSFFVNEMRWRKVLFFSQECMLISCFFPLLLLLFPWWPSDHLAATRLLMDIFTAVNWIIDKWKMLHCEANLPWPSTCLKREKSSTRKYLITRAKVILSWEEPCELSAGLWCQGQVLCHWQRCGRSFCGFSTGKNVRKGQLTSNCSTPRWLGWARRRCCWAGGEWWLTSACSSLASVLTCSIPVAMSKMRGFCGHSECQSCAASAPGWAGAHELPANTSETIPPLHDCHPSISVAPDLQFECLQPSPAAMWCRSVSARWERLWCWKLVLLAVFMGLSVGIFELSLALAEQIDFLTSHSKPAFPLY